VFDNSANTAARTLLDVGDALEAACGGRGCPYGYGAS
jgi:hypothetical protein